MVKGNSRRKFNFDLKKKKKSLEHKFVIIIEFSKQLDEKCDQQEHKVQIPQSRELLKLDVAVASQRKVNHMAIAVPRSVFRTKSTEAMGMSLDVIPCVIFYKCLAYQLDGLFNVTTQRSINLLMLVTLVSLTGGFIF